MRTSHRLALLLLLVAAPAIVVLSACNDSIDDPKKSDNLVAVVGVDPTVACAAVNGTLIDTNGDGTVDSQIVTDVSQTFKFESRVRGPETDASSIWSDVFLDTVTLEYRMDDGGAAPAPWVNRPSSPIVVKASGTSSYGMTTVKAADSGMGGPLGTAGRTGAILVNFTGRDAAGNPASVSCTVPLETADQCTNVK